MKKPILVFPSKEIILTQLSLKFPDGFMREKFYPAISNRFGAQQLYADGVDYGLLLLMYDLKVADVGNETVYDLMLDMGKIEEIGTALKSIASIRVESIEEEEPDAFTPSTPPAVTEGKRIIHQQVAKSNPPVPNVTNMYSWWSDGSITRRQDVETAGTYHDGMYMSGPTRIGDDIPVHSVEGIEFYELIKPDDPA